MGKYNYFFLLLLLFSYSCNKDIVFEEVADIDKNGWSDTKVINFNVDIQHAASPYELYYIVRYNNEYQNYNLYVRHTVLDTNGTKIHTLLQGMDLFKPTSGEPYGSGIGGTFDYLVLSSGKIKFPHAGKYTIQIQQYMRQPLLKGVEAFGIRLKTPSSQP